MKAFDNFNDDFLFIDDNDEDEIVNTDDIGTWKLLIVDDDPEIHSVTQLALSGLVILGRHLEYLHAYSGADACELIAQHDDVVVVLLDVVMETDDAGLKVVKYIRDELNRHDVRIVLRTGQPGYAPEESVIKDYDINDYKTKTELTRRKLVTTIFAAIRSYQQIDEVTRNRAGLERIISSSTELLEQKSIHSFANSVLTQLHQIIEGCQCGVFCARGQGILPNIDDLSFYILGEVGLETDLINQKVSSLNNDLASQMIKTCYSNKCHNTDTKNITLYLANGSYRAIIYLELANEMSALTQQLVKVFLSNVAIGYENVHLFHQLRDAAYKDTLTNLPNRLAFIKNLEHFSNANDQNLVAALIDINHFSDINDGLGQDIGNQLLIAVSHRIKQLKTATSGNTLQTARLGADVFGLIGPSEIVNPHTLSGFFDLAFEAGEQQLSLSACFGFCTKEQANGQGKKVLNQINIALNLAKKDLQNNAVFYEQVMEEKTLWRLDMIRQLRSDFADNRLELWYQPQTCLSTNKVIGAEALLRWRTHDGSFISPTVFIPLAEYTGLIVEIGDWVIEQACQQIITLEQQGFNDVSISVNVSIPQFRRRDFVDKIINKINYYKIKPCKMELEITENILMDDPKIVVDALMRLKKEGLRIALDDFGTGYSSLSYLQQLPLDRLKVDRAFVTDIAEPGQSIIADTIINLGKQMNLNIIAEGVENEDQLAHLKTQGCHDIQGFYFSKPLPSDEFIQYLAKNS